MAPGGKRKADTTCTCSAESPGTCPHCSSELQGSSGGGKQPKITAKFRETKLKDWAAIRNIKGNKATIQDLVSALDAAEAEHLAGNGAPPPWL